MPPAAAGAARESITGAVTAAGTLPQDLGAAVLGAARDAFSGGLRTVAAITAASLAVVAVLLVTPLRRMRPLRRPCRNPTGR